MNIYEKFKKCVQIVFDGDYYDYECKLGLWGITGADKDDVEDQALHYFRQYLADGEYDEFLREDSDCE